MGKRATLSEMLDYIANITMGCGQVPLDSSCGKYFNLMWFDDGRIMVESFERNETYGFTNINDLSVTMVRKIYKSLKIDFD